MSPQQQAVVPIGGRPIGTGHPCWVIAEIGVNHNGDRERAMALVDAAASAGADAVKFQTFNVDALVDASSPKAAYQKQTTDDGESQWDMLTRLSLSASDHDALLAHCCARGVTFLSTPFDLESVALLERLDVPAYKVASGSLTHHPLLRRLAATRKPIVLSTGMADMAEVDAAVHAIRSCDHEAIVLLHCVSNYPAAPRDANLTAMRAMAQAFGLPVGFSDHSSGRLVAAAAVALGATVIEKHITLDRRGRGPDHAASMEPDEFAVLVKEIRLVEAARGTGVKQAAQSELANRATARSHVVAKRAIARGARISLDDVCFLRPAAGISPSEIDAVVGRKAVTPIPKGASLTWNMITAERERKVS